MGVVYIFIYLFIIVTSFGLYKGRYLTGVAWNALHQGANVFTTNAYM